MKKLIGLISFSALFLLTACRGSNDVTVCTVEDNLYGGTMMARFESNDNEITSAIMEFTLDVSDMTDEEIQTHIDWELGLDDGIEYERDGDSLIFIQTLNADELQAETGEIAQDLDEMISIMQSNGAICETD